MARRAETKAYEVSAKMNGKSVVNYIPCTLIDFLYLERYFLMFWVGEAKVSIHKEHELKGHDFNVGSTASCRFGKVFYDGRIAGISKK